MTPLSGPMTTDAAIAALASWVKDGHPIQASAGESHPVSDVASQSLRFEGGLFVLEETSAFSGREISTRWTRTESGLADVLRANRSLLKLLLQASARFGPTVTGAGLSLAAPSVGSVPERLGIVLERLEAGQHWFLLAASPPTEMMREEALVYRPRIGWRCLETDCARRVGLESVLRRLKPPEGDDDKSPRERAALLVGAVLERYSREATPLPPELSQQLTSVERRLEDAVERLRAGEWWIDQHAQATGLVGGRGISVRYEDALLSRLLSQESDQLEERLLTAIVDGRAMAFGQLPTPVRATLETWLDPAVLAAQVRDDKILVEVFQPHWTSHESRYPTDPAEMAAWAASGRSRSRPALRPTAADELPEALRAGRFWTAERQDPSADAAQRSIKEQRAALVKDALAIVGAGQTLTDSREERLGTDSVRHEYELSRQDRRLTFVRRTTRMREAQVYEIDERTDVKDESAMRETLEGCLEADVEWLRRAVRR